MTVKCIKAKNYNLTVGEEYEVFDSRVGFYLIRNDKGISLPYSKQLFKEVVETAVNPTVEQILSNCRYDNYNITCNYNNNVLFAITISSVDYDFEGTEISCGIKQFSGINDIASRIKNQIDNTIDFLDENEKLELCSGLLKTYLYQIINERFDNAAAFVLLSTNIDNNRYYDIIEKALADLPNYQGFNPNSDNNITLWIYEV